MRVIEYRKGPFIDREKEENFLVERFKKDRTENILFVYGPKSSGKTTLLEYIVEEKLQKEPKKYYVNYVNFRRYAIHNYESFLNIYFQPIEEGNKPWILKAKEKIVFKLGNFKGEISIPHEGIKIGVNWDLYNNMKSNFIDPFEVFFETIKSLSKKRKVILIIDEVQELTDIYMNGELQKKYLLTEFFKFLVSLTKETHLAHIVVSTSSSIFIDEIYNNSKLAQTSEFYLVDNFDFETTKEWLQIENFTEDEIVLIWEYLGGNPFNINTLLLNRKIDIDFELGNYLKKQANIIADKIGLTISNDFRNNEEREYFEKLLKEILEKGFIRKNSKDELQRKVLEVAIDKDILFLRDGKIGFNSPIMRKGAEVYINERLTIA